MNCGNQSKCGSSSSVCSLPPSRLHRQTTQRLFFSFVLSESRKQFEHPLSLSLSVCVGVSLSVLDSGDVRLPAQGGGDSFPDELWRVSEEDAHQHHRTGLQRYQTQHRSTCPSPSPVWSHAEPKDLDRDILLSVGSQWKTRSVLSLINNIWGGRGLSRSGCYQTCQSFGRTNQ